MVMVYLLGFVIGYILQVIIVLKKMMDALGAQGFYRIFFGRYR